MLTQLNPPAHAVADAQSAEPRRPGRTNSGRPTRDEAERERAKAEALVRLSRTPKPSNEKEAIAEASKPIYVSPSGIAWAPVKPSQPAPATPEPKPAEATTGTMTFE